MDTPGRPVGTPETLGARAAAFAASAPGRAVAFTALFLGLLFGARVTLLLLHSDDAAGLGASDLLVVFARGVLFDASITLAVVGLPLFVMTLPFAWARRRAVQRVSGWWCYVAFVAALFLVIVDLVYYDYVHRHIGPEVAIATHDLDQNVRLGLQEHWPLVLGFVGAATAAFLLWRRLLRSGTLERAFAPRQGSEWKRVVTVALTALAIFCIARGSMPWQDRLVVEDAYEGVPPQAANLVLTGPFTIAHFLFRTHDMWTVDEVPWKEALATTTDLCVADDESVADESYPLARCKTAKEPASRPNVVVVLLEGWSASEVDVLRRDDGQKPLGLTPRFDALSREGVLFTRHYACGQRTRNGVAAVIAGLPSIPGMPYLGEGLEVMNKAYLGSMAASEGYSTYWLQGTRADSQQQDEIARWAGFEHFTSSEDIPVLNPVPSDVDTGSRAWDHDLFDEALKQISTAQRPFLAFVQTSNTHEPYLWPNDEWFMFTEDSRKDRYRNGVYYGDWALGRFFDGARRDGWFDDTIIVIVSDHTQRRMEGRNDPPSLFHIPCLVLAPGLTPGVSDRACGQADVIPTITHLAGWQTLQTAIGRSLLDGSRDATRGALCASGELLLRVERSGWVSRTSSRRVEAATLMPNADLDAIEHRLLAITEVYSVLMLRDQIAPPRFR